MRRLHTIATVAVVALSTPGQADARPDFPLLVDVFYCWDFGPCGYETFVMSLDRTFSASDGSGGEWNWSRPTMNYLFDGGTLYTGFYIGDGCFDGWMTTTLGDTGFWVGCLLL